MHLQDLKRWHWILIAIPIGLALSYAWTSVEPSEPRRLGQETFERQLAAPPVEGHPWLDNLVVHPPREGVMVVTGEQLHLRPNEKVGDYKPFAFNAITPYRPLTGAARRGPPAQPDSNETVLTYLAKVAARHGHVRFRYAWERNPPVVYALWTGGAVLLIGGVWPVLVNLLVGAGWGRTTPAEDAYDLERFRRGPEATPSATAGDAALQAAHLAEVEAELRRNLEGFGGGGAGGATAAVTAAEVRKLDGGPVDAPPLADDDPNREYKGEFYPVAKPHGKAKE